MIETIFGTLSAALAKGFGWLVSVLLGGLELDMKTFLNLFPIVATGYEILRAVGIGLVIIISIYGLYSFFFGSSEGYKNTPLQIIIRAFLSIFFVYFGGYLLEIIINIVKQPYSIFIELIPVATGQGTDFDSLSYYSNFFNGINDIMMAVGSPLLIVASFIISLLIAWNVIKLMLQVVERFLVLGILVYTSPLVFSTVTTDATLPIFKKWMAMFFGSCAMMMLSVWSFSVIFSGFSTQLGTGSSVPFIMRLVIVLAMCKASQKMDSYLEQLGINAPRTGGSLTSEIVGGVMYFGAILNKDTRKNLVDKVKTLGSIIVNNGPIGMFTNAYNKGINAYKSGAKHPWLHGLGGFATGISKPLIEEKAIPLALRAGKGAKGLATGAAHLIKDRKEIVANLKQERENAIAEKEAKKNSSSINKNDDKE